MTTAPRQAPATSFLRRLLYWLEPRWRDPGWLAFALNRLAGHILILYLLAHMVVLSLLAGGPQGWNALLEIFGSTPFLVGDVLLVSAVVFHGLNGMRVAAFTAGIGTRHPNAWVVVVVIASGALALLAAWGILL